MDLFQVARDNADSYAQRYEALLAAAGPVAADVERFVAAVRDEGRLAINRRVKVVLRFLGLAGSYYNMHELAARLEHRSGRPRNELLPLLLGTYYDGRMAFERCLGQGEGLYYAALNVGGLGATHYGEYCLVFRETFAAERTKLAYLWADSLETYLLSGCVVDEAGLQRDACPHSHRHCLAALKHGTDAAGLPVERWSTLVCSEEGFIEALFSGSPSPDDVEAVRVKKLDYDLYTDFVVEAATGQLGEDDRNLVDDFEHLLVLLEKRSIPLEKVEE